MKNYFCRLFDYDRYANEIIVSKILNAGSPEKPVQLMAHLLAAHQIWYNRCKDVPPIAGVLWPEREAGSFAQLIIDNHLMWVDFLKETAEAEFEKTVIYQNSNGETFRKKLLDILAHVVNHGTHHRAQAGQLLKLTGGTLPLTDYIYYLRELNK